jgi:hypothetical protein
MKNFNYLFLLLSIFILVGCTNNSSPPKTTLVSKQCPPKPPSDLVLKNPQVISLGSKLASVGKGSINANQTVGYVFQGKQDQKLSLELKPSQSCIWVITPNDDVLKEKVLPQSGQYIVQLAAANGEKIDYELSMGLNVEVAVAKPTPTPTPTPTPEVTPTPNNGLSQDDALSLVKTWYQEKAKIFGEQYQIDNIKEYATGKLYYETVEKCNDGICGGSVGWLKQNSCYWTYDFSEIKGVVGFSSTDNTAELTINLREQLQLHGPRSSGCGRSSQRYQKNVTYWLTKDGDKWKISNYKVGT